MGSTWEGFQRVNGQIQYGPARALNSARTQDRRSVRQADPDRFAGPHTRSSRSVVLLFGASIAIGGLLAAVPREMPGMAVATVLGGAWLSIVLAMTLPSRRDRAGAELSRRIGLFRHAINAIGDAPGRRDLELLLQYARTLELKDEEVAAELTSIRASMAALDLADTVARGTLPVLDSETLAPGDTCHFSAPVRFGRRRGDQFGHLLLTGGWVKFRGPVDLSVAWSEVGRVERSGQEIVIGIQGTRRTLRFTCQTLAEAARGGVLADYLAKQARDQQECRTPDYSSAEHPC